MCSLIFKGNLSGHSGPITAVVAPRGPIDDRVFSASYDKTIIVWDITREGESNYGNILTTLQGHEDVVHDIALSPVIESLVSASWDKTLRSWDIENGETLSTFEGHTGKVAYVSLISHGRRVVSSSEDKSIKVWGLGGTCQSSFTPSAQQQITDENPSLIHFTPNETVIFTLGKNLYVLDDLKIMMTEPAYLIATHKTPIDAIALSDDTNILASSSEDGEVILYDFDNEKSLGSLDIGKKVYALDFSPLDFSSDKWLAIATESSIEIWDVESKTKLNSVDNSSTCTSITWSGNGYSIYSGHSDNLVRAWEVDRP